MEQPLPASFYEKPTLELAEALIGKKLISISEQGETSGYIVETEAYIGPLDRAAHSFNNRRTKRTEVMYHAPGSIYTYVMHTHCLLNIVSGDIDAPEGVLIRALEPLDGLPLMYQRRQRAKKDSDLTSGPGKLTQALGITLSFYGKRIDAPPLFVTEGKTFEKVASGPRVGIDNSGEAKDYPWRFFVPDHPCVSKKRSIST
ncbi:DNA-3-methyladenine glycosylase [Salsuginibacillus kocurii]|uniref:DNA-3-methyladenine glycosylase n=1 Tax=Salsuginibacillus kocurii TaxID=427078 RepID=UPI00038147AA|nr:DNA-3-methyladenine glycosylase [Salsuginibacillus kocurii]